MSKPQVDTAHCSTSLSFGDTSSVKCCRLTTYHLDRLVRIAMIRGSSTRILVPKHRGLPKQAPKHPVNVSIAQKGCGISGSLYLASSLM